MFLPPLLSFLKGISSLEDYRPALGIFYTFEVFVAINGFFVPVILFKYSLVCFGNIVEEFLLNSLSESSFGGPLPNIFSLI